MEEKPDLGTIPLTLLWISIAGYYAYRSWFDPDGLKNSLLNDNKRVPNWYPAKDYMSTFRTSWKGLIKEPSRHRRKHLNN